MQNSEKISRDQVRDVPSLILVTEELMDRIDMLEKLILEVGELMAKVDKLQNSIDKMQTVK